MTVITAKEVEADFFSTPRLGICMMSGGGGRVSGVPVWFEWLGDAIQFFSAADAHKVKKIRAGESVPFLVTNQMGEAERWYAFEGHPELHKDGAFELASRLAEQYWDMSEPAHQQMVETWKEHAAHLCRVRLEPTRIRRGQ